MKNVLNAALTNEFYQKYQYGEEKFLVIKVTNKEELDEVYHAACLLGYCCIFPHNSNFPLRIDISIIERICQVEYNRSKGRDVPSSMIYNWRGIKTWYKSLEEINKREKEKAEMFEIAIEKQYVLPNRLNGLAEKYPIITWVEAQKLYRLAVEEVLLMYGEKDIISGKLSFGRGYAYAAKLFEEKLQKKVETERRLNGAED